MDSKNHLNNEMWSKNLVRRKSLNYIVLIALLGVFSSCTQRIIDFTIISSKNHGLQFDLSSAKRTEGKSMQFLAIGVTIKDAMDNALENAGTGYDLLIDGVVSSSDYVFVGGFKVTGTAVKSVELKAALGEEGFLKWQKENNVFNPETAIVQK